MDEIFPFASRPYCLMFLLLAVTRGLDVLSTWIATPNLALEGNPVTKALGWRWGILFNIPVSLALAFSPITAIAMSTINVLMAARNFQQAWLMRSLGEDAYRDWLVTRIQETRITLYLFCLAGHTLLTAVVGAAVVYFSNLLVVPFSIGLGIVCYALAVLGLTLNAVWRLKRAERRRFELEARFPGLFTNGSIYGNSLPEVDACGERVASDK